ncbi:MAG: MBL fold metallo-hydrolase [Clostridia bacterium]|nr:MBL fold metallo-hydrolase [Clostridia bacterium]
MKIIKLELGIIQTNCYILIDETTKKAAIIDPAICSDKLLDKLKSYDISDVEYILLTHGHFDHILGVAELKKIYKNAKVAIHSVDAVCLEDPKKSMSKFSAYLDKIQTPVRPDIMLKDNDEINLGELKLKVLHTPGHTPGSICFVCDDVIFSGDTLFCKTVGRTDLEGGNMDDMINSINRIGKLQGDYTVFPGHNRETTLDDERKNNRYMRNSQWS